MPLRIAAHHQLASMTEYKYKTHCSKLSFIEQTDPMFKTQYRVFTSLFAFSIFCIGFSLFKGSTALTWTDIFVAQTDAQFIFWQIRFPRTVTAFVCGGLLALAGTLMQLLLQNPLADPYALGISGGAAFCTLLLMLFGASVMTLFLGAWAGSILTILLIFILAKKHSFKPHALLLAGIAIAYGFSAGISCLLLLSNDANLHSMLFWLTGDLNDAVMPYLGISVLSIGFILCMLLAPGLNILLRGEKEAQSLGLASEFYRYTLFLLSSLFTATAVTISGCIGFIGLLIPHVTRRLVGFDHRIILPLSILLGGSLLTLADTFARSLFSPQQIPVGILTAALGVPIYIWLLQK